MNKGCIYGTHRVIEPEGVLPQPAWKIDNNTDIIFDNEILVDVDVINVNSSSFAQIYIDCKGDPVKIANRILKIIEIRGKLHNPVTGTGGILAGRIKKVGNNFNKGNFQIGDQIISLCSLTLIPLKIKKITKIDLNMAHLFVEGEAILFESMPFIKVPEEIPMEESIAILDEAGAPMEANNLCKEKDNVVIMGANGKIGLMCAFAIRQKLKFQGQIVGIVRTKESEETLKRFNIFDKVLQADALKAMEILKEFINDKIPLGDLTINCVNVPGIETSSVMLTKDGGTIFSPSLANDYNTASLTAEGIKKDLTFIAYKGYSHNHAEYALNLLKEYPTLRNLLKLKFQKNIHKNLINLQIPMILNYASNLLNIIDLKNYVFSNNDMTLIVNKCLKVAKYNCTVLIMGESGVGKDIITQIIHKASAQSNEPLIKVNCGAIPENLLEAELFGYEKGAFTGANNCKLGIFEIAQNGTLFLDEIGELPLFLQVKLLRVLQDGEFFRIGGTRAIKANARIIAATNRNLIDMVRHNEFRQDLFYRLNVFPIYVPPLRERKEDIGPLAESFVNKYNKKFELKKVLSLKAIVELQKYSWPGNVRELENLIQRLLICTDSNIIRETDVIENIKQTQDSFMLESGNKNNNSLKDVLEKAEYNALLHAINRYKSAEKVATKLNISHSTLARRLKKYGISIDNNLEDQDI